MQTKRASAAHWDINTWMGNDAELRELVSSLIDARERLRDHELTRLRREAEKLLRSLKRNRATALASEIACFKDVLALHQKGMRHGRD